MANPPLGALSFRRAHCVVGTMAAAPATQVCLQRVRPSRPVCAAGPEGNGHLPGRCWKSTGQLSAAQLPHKRLIRPTGRSAAFGCRTTGVRARVRPASERCLSSWGRGWGLGWSRAAAIGQF